MCMVVFCYPLHSKYMQAIFYNKYSNYNIRKKYCLYRSTQIRFNENFTDLFTKSLSVSTFKKVIYNIDIRQFYKLSIDICHLERDNLFYL